MSTDLDPLPPIRCCLCSWMTHEQDPAAREEAWRAHYYGLHPQPLVTRCMVPPYCGWTGTATGLGKLRELRAEHEATHAPPQPSKPQPRTNRRGR